MAARSMSGMSGATCSVLLPRSPLLFVTAGVLFPRLWCRTRYYTTKRRHTDVKGRGSGRVSYDAECAVRREEARRSILILEQPSPRGSAALQHAGSQLYDYCRRHGPIAGAFSYSLNTSLYTLVEYSDPESVQHFLASAEHFANSRRIPIQSRFVYFRPSAERRRRGGGGRGDAGAESNWGGLRTVVEGFDKPRLSDADLQNCASLSAQVSLLHAALSLSDLDLRLRYFLCSEFEAVLARLLPGSQLRLFGSSVTGLGCHDCDIDMTLDIDSGSTEGQREGSGAQTGGGGGGGVAYFMSKQRTASEREFTQRALGVVAGVLDQFAPQAVRVQRILRARVPIVKFSHASTRINCDLCMDNKSALDMSRLLHCLCTLDERVSPLVFAVRLWARSVQVTQTSPGPYFSNFMLSLLVVFHLQQKRGGQDPVLPPLRGLGEGQEPVLTQLTSAPNNTQPLDVLLVDFFCFYSALDFSRHCVSLVEGVLRERGGEAGGPTASPAPVLIENPLERGVNVSKNVVGKQLRSFQRLCAEAARQLTDLSGAGPRQLTGQSHSVARRATDQSGVSRSRVSQVFPKWMVDPRSGRSVGTQSIAVESQLETNVVCDMSTAAWGLLRVLSVDRWRDTANHSAADTNAVNQSAADTDAANQSAADTDAANQSSADTDAVYQSEGGVVCEDDLTEEAGWRLAPSVRSGVAGAHLLLGDDAERSGARGVSEREGGSVGARGATGSLNVRMQAILDDTEGEGGEGAGVKGGGSDAVRAAGRAPRKD